MEKFDIINGLAREFGFRRYLEICTPTTGLKFKFVNSSLFAQSHRLIYRCPDSFDDGMEPTFRTTVGGSHEVIRAIHALQPPEARYDIIFVDPFHTYLSSITDLYGAASLLAPNGVLVVHDCNPRDATIVGPEFQKGDWCGVTYQAFVDFILGSRHAGYCTVDTDYGCGVVFNPEAKVPDRWRGAKPSDRLVFDWSYARSQDDLRFTFFERHRIALLNLVTADQFAAVHPYAKAETSIASQPLTPPPEAEPAAPHVMATCDGQAIMAKI